MLARLIFLLLAAVATAGTLAACGGDDEEGEAGGTLQGVVWQWQGSLYSDESEAVPEDPAQYTIEFADDGSAAVKADCNQVRAQYESGADGTISIVLGPSTLAACPPGTLDAEFLRDLEGAAIYFFDDDGLLRIDIKFSTGTMTFDSAA